jgi:hypothetical protein
VLGVRGSVRFLVTGAGLDWRTLLGLSPTTGQTTVDKRNALLVMMVCETPGRYGD